MGYSQWKLGLNVCIKNYHYIVMIAVIDVPLNSQNLTKEMSLRISQQNTIRCENTIIIL